MKFLDIKDTKDNRVLININQVRKIKTSRSVTVIYLGDDLYTRTKLSIDELLNKITSL